MQSESAFLANFAGKIGKKDWKMAVVNAKKGHPRGLYVLFMTEMWERFSYYGMRAMFVLYMVKCLMLSKEDASQIYGSYTGLVYLTPLLGGYLADRFWGNRRSIVLGSVVMAAGQFLMFVSACMYTRPSAHLIMLVGLGLLILGNGFFKPNISSMVGDLYAKGDSRRDSAYTIFYMGVNVGAMIAPLWCGLVSYNESPEGFKWSFLSAAVGMLIGGLVFYCFKNKYLRDPEGHPIGGKPARTEKRDKAEPSGTRRGVWFYAVAVVLFAGLFAAFFAAGNDVIGASIYSVSITVPLIIITDRSLTTIEKKRIGVIYAITFFVIFFWAAFEQSGASLTFFANEQTDRHIFGWEMPVSYFQSFNPILIVALAPLFNVLWSYLRKKGKEPAATMKQAYGLILLGIGYLIIARGTGQADGAAKVSMMWLTGLYFMHTLGELCLEPIGMSIVNKLSPAKFSSLLMGVWYLSSAAANKFAGVLSGFYPSDGKTTEFLGYAIADMNDFFMLFVWMSFAAGIVLMFLSRRLEKLM